VEQSFDIRQSVSPARRSELKLCCQTAIARLRAGQAEDGGELDPDGVDAAVKAWQSRLHRVELGVGNCLLGLKEYELAFDVFGAVEVEGPAKGAMLSGLARVALLQGAQFTRSRRATYPSASGVLDSCWTFAYGPLWVCALQGSLHSLLYLWPILR
jgi:hypothetical protein